MGWYEAFAELDVRIASREQLFASGATGDSLTAAVRGGFLLRIRRDHYALPATDDHIVQAVRVGGRLACVSALADLGIFVFDDANTHVHLEHNSSRLRSPSNRFRKLSESSRDGCELHWWPLGQPNWGNEYRVGIFDALAQAVRCQDPWFAVASLDNAVHLRLIEMADLPLIFERVPNELHYIQHLVETGAEAGQESVLRMIIRSAGLHYRSQVYFPGVGRVDFVVEECFVLEADSRAYHGDWASHVRDRERDLLLASRGIPSLRPAYQHTMFQPGLVRAAILGEFAACRGKRLRFPAA